MTHNEKRLAGIRKELGKKADAIEAIWKKAEKEEREPSEDERAEVSQLLQDSHELKAQRKSAEDAVRIEEEVRVTARDLGAKDEKPKGEYARPKAPETPADVLMKSEGFKQAKANGFAGDWSSGLVEVGVKTTLVEGDNQFLEGGTPGAGAAAVPLDQRAGVLPILYQQNRVANLFAQGTTDSNAINYVIELTATNAADVVAEGTAKPESTLALDNTQDVVKKIATFLPVSDEMLEDAPQMRSYINARLSLFVQNEEDRQLLQGAGGGNFLGLMPRIPAANRYVTSSVGNANNADHIYEALTVARRSYLEPDAIVVNAEDWADLRLLKDSTYNYIAGAPFQPVGPGEMTDSLWGKRVVPTYNLQAGTALVGAFGTAAQVFRRGGLRVEATNSHSDYFQKNLTAVRAEQREALAVYRPSAFALADIGYAS